MGNGAEEPPPLSWQLDFLINDQTGDALLLVRTKNAKFAAGVNPIQLSPYGAAHALNDPAHFFGIVLGKADSDIVGVPGVTTLAAPHYSVDMRIQPKIDKVCKSWACRRSLGQSSLMRTQPRQQCRRIGVPTDPAKIQVDPLAFGCWEEIDNVHLYDNALTDVRISIVDDGFAFLKTRAGLMRLQSTQEFVQYPTLNGFQPFVGY
jgi:hypothetical protein